MRRIKNKFAILRMLASIAVLTSVCGLPAQGQLSARTTSTSYKSEATTIPLLSQTKEQRVSISFNDDFRHSALLLKDSAPDAKTSDRTDIRVWFGEFFPAQDLRVRSASPIEREPRRLGVKISVIF
jgi:hypothetical protein